MTSVQAAARSDVGCVRKNNEDAWAISGQAPDLWWAVVCDGMGGHAAGEVASRIAVDTFKSEFSSLTSANLAAQRLRDIAALANSRVLDAARADPARAGMGTTVAAMVVDLNSTRAFLLHAGDSRMYRLRSGEFRGLTVDHNLGEELVRSGSFSRADIAGMSRAGMLTRVIGMEDFDGAEVSEQTLSPGDVLLVCSDGLIRVLTDVELGTIIRPDDLDASADDLIRRTLERGAPDNVTLVLARIDT